MYEGDFGVLRAWFWHTRVTLGVLWCHFVVIFGMRSDFGCTLGQLWGHFWHMRVHLGPLWCHSGGTLGSLWKHIGATFGIFERLCATLRLLWDHCGVTLGV